MPDATPRYLLPFETYELPHHLTEVLVVGTGVAGYSAALAAAERRDETEAMERDFAALATGQALPLAVAARWAKLEPEFVLGWLARQVQQCVLRVFGAAAGGAGHP